MKKYQIDFIYNLLCGIFAVGIIAFIFYGVYWMGTPHCKEFTINQYQKGDVPVMCEHYWKPAK